MEFIEAHMDRRALNRLEKLGGSELIVRVIDQYLDKVSNRMEAACDRGRAGDLNAVWRAIHSIKSAASNVGATDVTEFAGRIEKAAVEGAKDMILPLLCQFNDMLGQVETWLQKEKVTIRSSQSAHWH